MGKSLLKVGEALEKTREKVEDQRNKYREARRQLEASSAKLQQQACLRPQPQNPGEQIQALCDGLGTQLKVLDQVPEIEAGEKQQAVEMFNQLQAYGAQFTALLANLTSKHAAIGATNANTAAGSLVAPEAPKVPSF